MAEFQIPKRQAAAVRVGDGEDARAPLKEIDVDLPGPDELLVKINWFESHRTSGVVIVSNFRTGPACAVQMMLSFMMDGTGSVLIWPPKPKASPDTKVLVSSWLLGIACGISGRWETEPESNGFGAFAEFVNSVRMAQTNCTALTRR